MTIQELDHYFAQSIRHRENIAPPDSNLESIRRALFSFFGVKDGKQNEATMNRMAKASITAEEKDAWLVAGMPSPMTDWLVRYRKEQNG